MLTFELDEENLRKAWGGSSEYWFSTKDYSVRDVVDIIDYNSVEETSKASYLISLGYIPYFAVSDEEVMYAFIQTITNEKLKAVFDKTGADDYKEVFWKYYNLYPELSDNFDVFEKNYLQNKAVKWCQANNINYSIK